MPPRPLGDKPMTATERQRKRRARLKRERGKQTPGALIYALRKENAALRRALAAATDKPKPD
jgi:hypothetical protein